MKISDLHIGDILKGTSDPNGGWLGCKCRVIAVKGPYGYGIAVLTLANGITSVGSEFSLIQDPYGELKFWELDSPGLISVPVQSVSGAVINNHTCPTCKNTRCNKTEKSCWRCGSKL